MQKLSNLLIGIIFTIFLIIFAVFSIQNITQISVKFFLLESIKLPLGILLCISFGFGIIFGSFLPLLSSSKKRKQKLKSNNIFTRKLPQEEQDPLFDWE